MKILISGSSGLVGSRLTALLKAEGHEVLALVRRPAGSAEIHWDPVRGELDAGLLEGLDGVVHLAGENIAEGRWTAAKKERIRASRVASTDLLCRALAGLQARPAVLVNASAIGYYGDRGDQLLDEESPAGDGFLPEVCQAWEAATQPASEAGIRVVRLRIGVVLSVEGGALQKMLLPFRLGAGGKVGSGRQYWSWISIDDLAGVINFALTNASLSGAVNAVAPQPVTNQQFTKTLGRVLGRPTILPMPAFAARLALGEMANDLLLASTRVAPTRLEAAGYTYRHPDLESALRHLLVPT
ncbi:MAG: TIGR01777 family protein [Planctomycetales bacterium]|nr:TIGR01777 family protein [Planctomycetales bacterium]NIM08295.1 TIGR01777 family protein [Planctomycetales bacterium]NIN07786.1 TIGR01777 family protein [Planctomycetales bacterium]NIN76906.1 TIGR01777 family protein [Planctomycetales bacterium]NIO34105.1 TIGR01777 family protein [Planctomycetales bacterium]